VFVKDDVKEPAKKGETKRKKRKQILYVLLTRKYV